MTTDERITVNWLHAIRPDGDSIDEGKQLAEQWYRERLLAALEEVKNG